MMRLSLSLALLFIVSIVPAFAQAPALFDAEKIISGHEIGISDDRVLELAGIAEPFPEPHKWREEARSALSAIVTGHKLIIEDVSIDRYGRMSGNVYVLDGNNKIWLQGELLKRGLAFVYPPTGKETRLEEMRLLETGARHAQAGIWSDAAYTDLPIDKVFFRYGRFAFVSGKVTDVVRAKGFAYIHFGDDWRETLTIAIAGRDLRSFTKAGINVMELKDKTIRLRGWVKKNIGPMITLTDPAQMEIITP